MAAKTKQYGSHMVMTNVHKETKKKYLNIDTRFREDYSYSQTANYVINLPEKITEVKSMYITNIEIPDVLYNLSSTQNNNSFVLTQTTNATPPVITKKIITVPSNKYAKITDLHNQLNYQFTQLTPPITDISFSYDVSINKTKLGTLRSSNKYNLNFAVDASGNFDRSLLNSKMGWILGFRDISLNISPDSNIFAPALPDIFGPKYLYLAIDEFSNGNQRSFVSSLPRSLINKNIIARISVSTLLFGFNNLISANRADGSMVSDKRVYSGKIDLQKLHVQILDEYGNPVSLNGLDFSFCVEVEHE